ncbi:MAG TPA: hypothetical protein VKE51_24620 [Vicinamibacterales bacterium]|nr:hypothetical protein [Vicinamibacterales bacterium]
MCCGTKRLTQIACPSDCPWLVSAREHPAAVVVRQLQRDIALMRQVMRDFDQRQSQLFLLINTFLLRYQAPEIQPLVDDDVAEAMAALASTYETASRGLIYEHRPASLPAERLVTALKPLLAKASEGGGSAFERDLAVVLRRAVDMVHEVRASDPENRRAFVEFLLRVVARKPDADESPQADAEAGRSRLIIP